MIKDAHARNAKYIYPGGTSVWFTAPCNTVLSSSRYRTR